MTVVNEINHYIFYYPKYLIHIIGLQPIFILFCSPCICFYSSIIETLPKKDMNQFNFPFKNKAKHINSCMLM